MYSNNILNIQESTTILNDKKAWKLIEGTIYDIITVRCRFGLVWFYSISSIVGYFMPNPVFTYVLNI